MSKAMGPAELRDRLGEIEQNVRRARALFIVTREAVVDEPGEVTQAVFEVAESGADALQVALDELEALSGAALVAEVGEP